MKVLSFVEQHEGRYEQASLECLRLASRLADEPVSVILAGHHIAADAAELAKYGAKVVYVADREEFRQYSCEGYTAAIDAARKAAAADAVLMAATAMGRDLAPRLAARNGVGVLTDVTDLQVEEGRFVAKRPVYSGKAFAIVDCGPTSLQVITTRPNVFPLDPAVDALLPAIKMLELGKIVIRSRVTKVERTGSNDLDVAGAVTVVSAGRGIKQPGNLPIIQDLVEAFGSGAALGASRAIVDAGWMDHRYQVGQTGKLVSPTLYVAIGISGAVQHLAGMSSSKVIVAINQDPYAPIFKVANYGVVADMFSFVPELAKAVRAIKLESDCGDHGAKGGRKDTASGVSNGVKK